MGFMEMTLQTKGYQDPAESYKKPLRWSATFTDVDEDSTVCISADDWSGREITLPLGVILEIAERLRTKQSVA